mmetsp:Transcript_114411/g.180134  ORF Transcript_114411/g.180134 Transcript_114411/m.180134 type:complete len:213 (-) Transcript_114411:40-678(-)|eukprot:CAMPEP_0169111302 /NCGR_PEP_ID=MMETSP1015-20121227/26991_1 /TAXON_ID=342587 /ORGANISM="Karlodinium micrum, Strain CCMP2283" /LENGTH=212 /DNA_ID=CAMNT_0009173187 /DNA_START=65 /DNA_END=703 /DNA_ORIENTATION=-
MAQRQQMVFSGSQSLLMSKAEATLCSLNKSEQFDITQKHASYPKQEEPSLERGGWKKTYLTRHKTAGVIVSERGSQATMLLTNLDKDIKDLDALIQKDEKSLKEMDRNLATLKLEALRIQRKLEDEEALVKAMGSTGDGLGSAMKAFDTEQERVKKEYKYLRGRHADAIGLLKTEFGYNPAFKKGLPGGNEFRGAYYTLAKDPSKLLPTSNR